MEERKIVGYVCGTEWFSDDQGGWPNYNDFPHIWFQTELMARDYLEDEARHNTSGYESYTKAYMCPVYDDGTFGDKIYE